MLCLSVYFVLNVPLLLKLSILISLVVVNIKSTMQFHYTWWSVFEVSFTFYINEFHVTVS